MTESSTIDTTVAETIYNDATTKLSEAQSVLTLISQNEAQQTAVRTEFETYLALGQRPGRIAEELTAADRVVVIDEIPRLPELLTVLKEANEIRYASLPNLIKSVKLEPQVWDNKVLGLDPDLLGLKGSPTQVVKIFSPPLREGGKLISASEEEIVKIVDQLMPQIRSEASCAI